AWGALWAGGGDEGAGEPNGRTCGMGGDDAFSRNFPAKNPPVPFSQTRPAKNDENRGFLPPQLKDGEEDPGASGGRLRRADSRSMDECDISNAARGRRACRRGTRGTTRTRRREPHHGRGEDDVDEGDDEETVVDAADARVGGGHAGVLRAGH